MRKLCTVVFVVLLAGCVQVPKEINVNLNGIGGSDDSEGTSSGTSSLGIPSSSGGGWKETAAAVAGQVFLASEHGVLFYAFDTLAYPGQPVDLAARAQAVKNMKGIKGLTVSFVEGDEPVAVATTDGNGLAKVSWTPPKEGDYKLKAVITGRPEGVSEDVLKVSPSPLLVAARDKESEFVVIDLDHTVVDSSFFHVLLGNPTPMAGSVDVAKRISESYSIIYLTHRPDLLARKSKDWLARHKYPDGPLLVSELRDAFGDSGKFKTAKLKAVKKSYGNVKIGIGDKLSDAQAYVDNGLIAYLIPHYKEKPDDMQKMAGSIRKLDGRGRLNVVDGWREIEMGVFKGRKYNPSAYAGRLDRRAKQLAREQRRRREKERDRDDDDDDDEDEDDEDDD